MSSAWRVVLIATITAYYLFGVVSFALAQNLNRVAQNVELESSGSSSGQVVSYKDGKYNLSNIEYDNGIYGVIDSDAEVILGNFSSNSVPVVVSGEVMVKVNSNNGDIQTGDLLTSSKDLGIAQKATRSGHVLGKALKDFPNDDDKGESGTIPVLLNVNYNQISSQSEGLTSAGIDQVAKKVSSSLVSGNLPELLKYIFALILGAISFFVGLSHFVRSNRTAVEAIARNPLAKADIQRQLVFGTAGILVVCTLGLAIAVWILLFL
jgi:hypothetical protein